MSKKVKVSIYGATGYAGMGLYQGLKYRDDIKIAHLISKSAAGKLYRETVGAFQGIADERLEALDGEQVVRDSDVIFTALPHGQSMELALEVKKQGKMLVDLGADFRLEEQALYEKWYQVDHVAPELLDEAVYSIPELHRGKITKDTWLIANPGCYPTSIQLPLAPLLEAGIIEEDSIIADAKSGVSGAGRAPKLLTHFCEEDENLLAYGTGKHRHKPEMESHLTPFGHKPVKILFSPHLVPMTRGIFSTIYCQLKNKAFKEDEIRDVLIKHYQNEAFVKILDKGVLPTTKWVFGTNLCHINVVLDEDAGVLVVLSVIDNLGKGASGQAIQNMNILFGLEETKGLLAAPVFP
ncbi:hypothetical protein AZF37_08530 [endosymbiont 'TC1' of Trimyema compressum]|uniref:N-acetyl-gamma-glutamyl-phosphate reductase n=1 Tax=endosymbiont 'TC1' of Trimyema compressum TaxID=243899 RepID=UPI0007F0A006|nr:N-acetyl-gamma-glutamyl-phosphate reductase [endosymbiont 'TC1' of Trimyema compressum]AMP21195.1 hypothetical protein AZF37_08530 [endosymbiont 'TC1' of Trimyema compressum]